MNQKSDSQYLFQYSYQKLVQHEVTYQYGWFVPVGMWTAACIHVCCARWNETSISGSDLLSLNWKTDVSKKNENDCLTSDICVCPTSIQPCNFKWRYNVNIHDLDGFNN